MLGAGARMEIHKKRRPELVAGLRECLRAIWVDHQIYVDVATLVDFDEVESRLSTEEQKVLKRYVGERPLVNFAQAFLNNRFEYRAYTHGARERLTEFCDVHELAEAMVCSIEKLPHEYTFALAFSDALNSVIPEGQWSISPTIHVAKGDLFRSKFPFHREEVPDDDRFMVKFAKLLDQPVPAPDKAHIIFCMSGYLQRFSASPSQEVVDLQIRSFFGLALVFNVVQYHVPPPKMEHVYVYAHVPNAHGPNEPWLRFALSTSTSRVIQALNAANTGPTWGWTDLAGNGGEWVRWVLEHHKGERLVRAARWFFDSFGADSLLLQYLQAMICLEILVGDEASKGQETSIVFTLKNRCAYLIGVDLAERDKIMRDIGRIYQVRSDIVHNGLSQLSTEDRALLPLLRWYCARVITTEAQRLGAVVPPPPNTGMQLTLENAEGAKAGQD